MTLKKGEKAELISKCELGWTNWKNENNKSRKRVPCIILRHILIAEPSSSYFDRPSSLGVSVSLSFTHVLFFSFFSKFDENEWQNFFFNLSLATFWWPFFHGVTGPILHCSHNNASETVDYLMSSSRHTTCRTEAFFLSCFHLLLWILVVDAILRFGMFISQLWA